MSAPNTAQQVITAAFAIAKDAATAAEARTFNPADLDAELVQQCRELFGQVVGSGDPLWPLQTEIARGVLAVGGLGADELSEWTAVARRRAAELPPTDARPETTDSPESTVTEPYSPDNPEDSE